MSVRRVLRLGHPLLRERSHEVNDFSVPELQILVADLLDTMEHEVGAGIAAPQIGVLLRVVIFGIDNNARYPEAEPVPTTVLINPKIEILGQEMKDGWEGCLSVPGMRGLVSRYTKIRYSGFDQHFQPIERIAEDFHARVVQHECDHLDGILFPERIEDMRQFGFKEELAGKMEC